MPQLSGKALKQLKPVTQCASRSMQRVARASANGSRKDMKDYAG